jgi:two-component system, OmpR family, response regulator
MPLRMPLRGSDGSAGQPRSTLRYVRILVAESDRPLGEVITRDLRGRGYVADLACDAEAALTRARCPGGYAAAVIGWRLPGLDAVRRIRVRDTRLPVLLTGNATALDRVAGLDAGADDFLAAPLCPGELAARLRALLRRERQARSPVLAAGNVTWDPALHEARAAGHVLALTATEASILELLLRRSPAVVTRADIARHAWDHDPAPNVISVHVARVRAKLGPAARVETVRGIGYRLRATT